MLHVRLGERFAVAVDLAALDLDGVPRLADDALHEVLPLVPRPAEDDHVAVFRLAERMPQLARRGAQPRDPAGNVLRVDRLVSELVDEHAVLVLQEGQHAGAFHPVVLHAALQQQDEERGERDGLDGFTEEGTHGRERMRRPARTLQYTGTTIARVAVRNAILREGPLVRAEQENT